MDRAIGLIWRLNMTAPQFRNSKANGFTRMTCRAILAAGLIAWSTVTLVPRPLYAQSDTGRITGSVVDFSGAIITGAAVKLTNADTGAVQVATSGSDGS